MRAEIQWQEDVHFMATTGSGHRIPMDGPADSGGANRGARPMELLLTGLGGCASFDVVTILRKARQQVVGCVAEVEAERAAEVPQVFTRIHLHFRVSGHDLDPRKVQRAVALSAEKYCSASLMLQRGGVVISHDVEVLPAPQTR